MNQYILGELNLYRCRLIYDGSDYCLSCVEKAQLESINKNQRNHDNKKESSSAESVLTFNSYFTLISGIIAFIYLLKNENDLVTPFILLISSIITWSVLKVLCNISDNLHEINSKLKK